MANKRANSRSRYEPRVDKRTFRAGKRIITVETTSRPALIDYQDLLDLCEVEEDNDSYRGAPWEDDDYFEHQLLPVTDEEHHNAADVVRDGHYSAVVFISTESMEERCGRKHNGEHEQVYRERMAQRRRRIIDQIVRWYDYGYTYCTVSCELYDNRESVGDVLLSECRRDRERELKSIKQEVVSELVYTLGRIGYEIINHPDWRRPDRAMKQQRLREKIAAALDFDNEDDYRAWIEKRQP